MVIWLPVELVICACSSHRLAAQLGDHDPLFPFSKPSRCWKIWRVERMIWREVFWFQAAADALLQASDA